MVGPAGVLLAILLGIVLGSAGLGLSDWQFWAVLAIVAAQQIIMFLRGQRRQ